MVGMNLSYNMWQAMASASGAFSFRFPKPRTWRALERRGLVSLVDSKLIPGGLEYKFTDKGFTLWATRPGWMKSN